MLIADIGFLAKNFVKIISASKEKEIGKILIQKKLSVSCAESCTGGLLSSRLTDVSGSSAYICQNFVTYANEAKVNILNVNNDTINNYGVVSEQVALEMAEGLINKYNCDIAISTTGIAGPAGATENKPVGLICFAILNKKSKKVYKFNANSQISRRLMKYAFSSEVLEKLLIFLKENY